MVLGKLPVPGRPTNLDNSRTKAYCAFSRCGRGGLDIFSLIYHFSSFSLSLGDGLIYTELFLKGPLSQKTTNQSLLQFTNSMVLVILHVTKNGHCNRVVTAILRRLAITIRYCIKSSAERY